MQVILRTCVVFLASESLVIMCHMRLAMPALLCTPDRHLSVYSFSNLWNISTDQSHAFLPKSALVRISA